jgi:probable HAF family extracellular repeat protein
MVRRRFRRRERRGVSHVQIQPTVLPAPDPGTIAVSSIAVLSIAALVCGAAMAAPRYTSFSVPDGSDTRAFGINSVGQVVGRYMDPTGVEQAFLRYTDGSSRTFSAPGGVLGTWAQDINDR